MTAVFLFLLLSVSSKSRYAALDTLYYNERLQMLTECVAEQGRSSAEEVFGCRLLYFSDEDYKGQMNTLLQSGAVILDYYENGEIVGKAAWNDRTVSWEQAQKALLARSILFLFLFFAAGCLLIWGVWFWYVRPFARLKAFAAQIAKGNLDFSLPMEKHNVFGAFTESFDIMREELKRARESEYRANKSKKELTASLSHDMKTPLATIEAACEVIQVKEKNQDTLEKVAVIAAKAEMMEKLTDNMLKATLEELEVLRVEPSEESSLVIADMFAELRYYGEIKLCNEIPECLVFIDKMRLSQVIDNIVNNAFKYAGGTAAVSVEETGGGLHILIRDRGKGVPEEELALLCEKFYRGSNAQGQEGAGLGLYLAKMFMERMGGGMECGNDGGFFVRLYVKKAGNAMKAL